MMDDIEFDEDPIDAESNLYWQQVERASLEIAPTTQPADYLVMQLDYELLQALLNNAPQRSAEDLGILVELPMPDGHYQTFEVFNQSVMALELAAKFPEIQTYSGWGIDDPAATIKLDMTPQGFHAMVLQVGETVYIDPYQSGMLDQVIVYDRSDFYATSDERINCLFNEEHNDAYITPKETSSPYVYDNPPNESRDCADGEVVDCDGTGECWSQSWIGDGLCDGTEQPYGADLSCYNNDGGDCDVVVATVSFGDYITKYQLAVATTYEYTQYHGGTVEDAMAAVTTTINRVNGVYEKELAVAMELVVGNDALISTTAADGYTNNDGHLMLGQNQAILESALTAGDIEDFDIGHVFSTGGGGVAGLGVVCTDSAAQGVTGRASPVGDPFDIDYVAHEVGHQFGANHTFNNSCSSNINTPTAYEPGSASTIMGYAGICSPNLQANSDPYFHVASIVEIDLKNFDCGDVQNAIPANAIPTANANPTNLSESLYIPVSTAFKLTGDGTDTDINDMLTYSWEQYDLGPQTSNGDNDLTSPSGNQPIFRAWSPTTDETRVFLKMDDLLNNAATIGELLPTYTRDLTFVLTVRDNKGGVSSDIYSFQVDDDAGPFTVMAPNGGEALSGEVEVTWNVAATDASPVSCDNVEISLHTELLDAGNQLVDLQLHTVLQNSTPNDGAAMVMLPSVDIDNARVMVSGAACNNIFFDISDDAFSIASIIGDIDGDINFDGNVDVSDLNSLVTFILESAVPTGDEFTASDINDDALLNVLDIIRLVNIIFE